MTRLLLRAFNAPALLLIVLLGIALQTSLFASYPLHYIQPDIILLVVIWFAVKRKFTEGGILTLILGNFAEIHSAAPAGLLMICYILVYLLIRLLSRLFVIPNFSSLTLITMGSSILWKLLNLGVLYLMGVAGNQWRHTLLLLMPGAVIEGLLAIWAFRWLERFDSLTFKSTKAQQALEEELQLEGEF